jgi:hypothetical protein
LLMASSPGNAPRLLHPSQTGQALVRIHYGAGRYRVWHARPGADRAEGASNVELGSTTLVHRLESGAGSGSFTSPPAVHHGRRHVRWNDGRTTTSTCHAGRHSCHLASHAGWLKLKIASSGSEVEAALGEPPPA